NTFGPGMTGLAYSTDGIIWNGYDSNSDGNADPVLGGSEAWASTAEGWTILKNAPNDFEMWYSGGNGASGHGIGYATSTDGLVWVKDASNPIFHKSDGITWRDDRTYTPSVIKDGANYKMWFTGKDVLNGDYSLGYATWTPTSVVWVDDNYTSSSSGGHIWGYDAFDKIQDGINAVVGSTVNVAAGIYREQLYIDKSLDLVGAGELTTTIEAPDVGNRTTYTVATWAGSTKTIDAVVGVYDAGTVNISGFTVDGRDTGPANYYGIHYFNTGGLITQNTIEKITYPAVPGAQAVLCLVATHGVGESYDIDIIDNYIPDFQKGGIALKGPGCTFTVNDNNVIGSSTPNIAGNCIQLSYGASGTTSGNIVEGVIYTGSGWTSTGILLFESGDIDMVGDEVFNCQSGVNFSDWGWGYTNPNPVNLTFTDLNLHDNEWTFASQQSRDGSQVNITMTDCDILDNGGDGIELYGTDLDPWGGGYYTGWDNGSLTASITGCTITNSLYDGIWLADLSGNTTNTFDVEVHGCTFTGNTQSAINNQTSFEVDAENNYWGDDSGPSVGAKSSNMRPVSKMALPNEMTVKEYKQLFTNSADPVKGSGETILGLVDYSPWCNSTFTNCSLVGPGPITTIPDVAIECASDAIAVPVTVTDFNNVGAISLVINYNNTNLYIDPIPNPPGSPALWDIVFNTALSGATYNILPNGIITISYFSSTGVNLTDGETLFTMNFDYIGGDQCPNGVVSDLTWINSDPTYLEYATPDGFAYDDDPFADFYFEGSVHLEHTTIPAEVGGPVATSSTVECVIDATAPTTLPVVQDVCGNVLSPAAAVKQSLFVEDFSTAVTIGATQAPGVWYVDRYAPAGFVSPVVFDGDDRLKHSIAAAD
ncbi:MAG: hypothetical protein K8R74_05060, partial [Bacteroidales bacterium]|nr:hypothetical protein [Bacteroidales bacterium]